MTMYGLTRHTERNKIVVIKVGGSILSELPDSFFKDIVNLLEHGWFPVIVHGGGPSISNMLERLGIESLFVNGLRVTDKETLDVVQMVLNGKENTEVVKKIHQAGGKSVGLSGVDEGMIIAEQLDASLGYVGRVKKFSFPMLKNFQANKIIPVISPLGMGVDGQIYNINADTVAQSVAIQLNAKKILMVSDIPGVYDMKDGEKKILHLLTPDDIEELKCEEQVTGGMIPKVEAAVHCLKKGIEDIYILDGREEGIISKIYSNQLIGTKIYQSEVVV